MLMRFFVLFYERWPPPERVLASIIPGGRQCTNPDHQQLFVAQPDGQWCRADDGCSPAGVPVADRRDSGAGRMYRHREWFLLPDQHQQHGQQHGVARRQWRRQPSDRQPDRAGCRRHNEETRGFPFQSRPTGEAGEQIDQDVVPLQEQQRYGVRFSSDFSDSRHLMNRAHEHTLRLRNLLSVSRILELFLNVSGIAETNVDLDLGFFFLGLSFEFFFTVDSSRC